MGKFSGRASSESRLENHPDKTTNYEGGLAYSLEDELRFYSRVSTSMVNEPKFYKEDENQEANFLLEDTKKVLDSNPELVLQMAAYARNELYLRSVPIVLLVEASLHPKGKEFVRKYTPAIIKRADEFAEAVAYLQTRIGNLGDRSKKGSMPASLKKGLADTLHNFDEYQFAKYDKDGTVKLKDVVSLVHPKPETKEEAKLFKRILERKLKTPETWEVEISKGSTKENWERISEKMGYMAILRNLRNMLQKGVNMTPIAAKIADAEAVKKSKQLPFRFYSAYNELENVEIEGANKTAVNRVLDAIELAMDASVENVPMMPGKTLVLVDMSNSMNSPLSKMSSVSLKQIGCVLGSIVSRQCSESAVVCFGDYWKEVRLSSRNGVICNTKKLLETDVGCSTFAGKALQEYAVDGNVYFDRIILLSDMQCYGQIACYSDNFALAFNQYKNRVNRNVLLYSIDLAGYGTLQVPSDEPRTALIAGFSERIFDLIRLFEKDSKTALNTIKAKDWSGIYGRKKSPNAE